LRTVEGVFATGTGDLSLLAALFVCHAGYELVPLTAAAPPGPNYRLDGGTQQIPLGLAAALGERVILNAPVVFLDHGPEAVVARTERLAVRAQRAIVTLPPPVAARIHYRPALPAGRDQFCQRAPMGWVIKTHLVYETPFWRAAGLSGAVTGDLGAVRACADNTPPSGTPGILLAFVEGEGARLLARASAEERRAAVLADVARYFGAAAARPLDYYEKSWGDDPHSRGCYAGYFTTGVWTTYGDAVRAPVGVLHWGGTESSEVWNGKMEGAVAAGERVAAEVLAALGGRAEVGAARGRTA
jgi:monoamine oxidase